MTKLLTLFGLFLTLSATTAAKPTDASVKETLDRLAEKDPSAREMLDSAAGFVVFPTIGKGGFIIGAAFGKGTVYAKGKYIGNAKLAQGSIGAQIGGQTYSEIIVLKDKRALDKLKSGELALSSQVSAVWVQKGTAKSTRFQDGVAVLLLPKSGAMAEATVAGQKITFTSRPE